MMRKVIGGYLKWCLFFGTLLSMAIYGITGLIFMLFPAVLLGFWLGDPKAVILGLFIPGLMLFKWSVFEKVWNFYIDGFSIIFDGLDASFKRIDVE